MERRRGAPRKEKLQMKCLSKRQCENLIRCKLSKNREKSMTLPLYHYQIQQLLSQSSLECTICLQILLKPCLSQCGHIFCLHCAEDLAKNNFSCGICHKYQPDFDLKIYRGSQKIIQAYLSKCGPEQRLIYDKRQKEIQCMESNRLIGQLQVRDYVDFWCIEQKKWKCGIVTQISRTGMVCITQAYQSKVLYINITSRRLAKYRHFTKASQPIVTVPVNQATNLNESRSEGENEEGMFGGAARFVNIFETGNNQDFFDLLGFQNPFQF